MVGKIIYSSQFVRQLDELAQTFYKVKYFGFIEDVDLYIGKSIGEVRVKWNEMFNSY